MNLPEPSIKITFGLTVVDDSAVGTKTRIARGVARQTLCKKFFYATTPDGASPPALAQACRENGISLTLLSTEPKDKILTPVLMKARDLGASIEIIPTEFRDVEQLAKIRAAESQAEIFDFESEMAIDILADYAKSLGLNPGQVWSASARGAMSRSYQKAWPDAEHFAVIALDHVPGADFGKAGKITMPTYNSQLRFETPFECNQFYEARAWPIALAKADLRKKPLFWNPAGPN